MEAKSTDKKTFQLTDNGQLLGELIYESLFFLKAEIQLKDSTSYKIEPVGVFDTSIHVTKNGAETAKLVMNWRGQIVITFQDEQEFVLRLSGVFNGKYILENKDKEMIILLEPNLIGGSLIIVMTSLIISPTTIHQRMFY